MQILNIDDDIDDRDMFCMAIEMIDRRIDCVQVESGELAIKLLANGKYVPEFIFMDINMPRMNGYECVQELINLPTLKSTQIVILSSTFSPRDQIDFGALGLKYLSKTSSLSSLADSIKQLIQR
ncbi:response regulator [Chryseolinea sp. T2]|uniref:response regulator n=1 Tax=Chryseolinea sp. T2 TaxID=3129255 RepID=UPI0030775783